MLADHWMPVFALQAAAAESESSLDVWELLTQETTIVVKLVMLVLIVMSLMCWFIIGAKMLRLIGAWRQTRAFLKLFWAEETSGVWNNQRLEGIYSQLKSVEGSPVARTFRAGYVELARLSNQRPNDAPIENVERAVNRARVAEMTKLESLLSVLATTGSAAPFIGLFGTVWGIMDAFIDIRNRQGGTSLDVVAPGIAEALIATAIGLLAAIPAVVAYNFFVRRLRVIESELETFSNDFLNVVRRHFV